MEDTTAELHSLIVSPLAGTFEEAGSVNVRKELIIHETVLTRPFQRGHVIRQNSS